MLLKLGLSKLRAKLERNLVLIKLLEDGLKGLLLGKLKLALLCKALVGASCCSTTQMLEGICSLKLVVNKLLVHKLVVVEALVVKVLF